MYINDYLEGKISIDCCSNVEINSMLCILRKLDDDEITDRVNSIKEYLDEDNLHFNFFRENNKNYVMTNGAISDRKAIRFTKDIYKKMLDELNLDGFSTISPYTLRDSDNITIDADGIRIMQNGSCVLSFTGNNLYNKEEDQTMINVKEFLKKYKEMVLNKEEKELKEKIEKIKEEDCYLKQFRDIKKEIADNINYLITKYEEEKNYIDCADIQILIKHTVQNSFLSEETKKRIAEAEQKHAKSIEELNKSLEEIALVCSLTTDEEKIAQILINYKILNKNGTLNI